MIITSNRLIVSIMEKAAREDFRDDFMKSIESAKKDFAFLVKKKNYVAQTDSMLFQMAWHMFLGNTFEAAELSDRLTKLAAEKCATPVYVTVLIESGYLYQHFLEYKNAEVFAVRALTLSRDNNLARLEADALLLLAILERFRRNYHNSLIYVRQAEKCARSSGHHQTTMAAMLVKGRTLTAMGDFEEALNAFEGIELESKKLKLPTCQTESIMLQGDVYRTVGDVDQAQRFYKRASSIPEKSNRPTITLDIFQRVGYLLLHKREYKKALDWYAFTHGHITRYNYKSYFPYVFLGYGMAYNGLENYKKALGYLWTALDLIAPSYLLNCDVLKQILEQLQFAFCSLHQEVKSKNLLDMSLRIDELLSKGADNSHQSTQFGKILEMEISELLRSVRLEEVPYLTRYGVRVQLDTGAVYGASKYPICILSEIQLRIFNLLIKHMGHPVSNREIIGCYQKSIDGIEGVPRRAHYYISEIRKKLDKKSIIHTVKGSGYMIPHQ